MRFRFWIMMALAAMLAPDGASLRLPGQSVQPIISEYTGRADGYLEVTNSSTVPQIVVLEPKSFSVNKDGSGSFRPLDANVHLELSATSIRVEPLQTARVFYKVRSDALPAWLCIYAAFTPVKKAAGINVRIMLPHTVYLFQKEPFPKGALHVLDAYYDAANHKVLCHLENASDLGTRAESMELKGEHDTVEQGGFPVLPQLHRELSIAWNADQPPQTLLLHFPKFDVKIPVSATKD